MQIGEHAVLISHGDIYCTDDVNYQKIRQQLRAPNWQQQFLQQALVVRKEQVRAWRKQSQEAQKGAAEYLLDVNQDSISQWFEKTGATRMVHGHTHRPGCYLSADQKLRYVLPDWDYDEAPLRGGYLSIEDDQWALSLNSNYPK